MLMKALVKGWEVELPPLPSTKGAGEAFFFWWWRGGGGWGVGRTLFGLSIFTFHSLPQIGDIGPVPDSDVLSSQVPTNTCHPGVKITSHRWAHLHASPSCHTAAWVGVAGGGGGGEGKVDCAGRK